MKTNRRNSFQTTGLGAAVLGIVSALPLTSCAVTAKVESETDEHNLNISKSIIGLSLFIKYINSKSGD